jgi:hypothetical protein
MKRSVTFWLAAWILLTAPPAAAQQAEPEILTLIEEAGGPEAYPEADLLYILENKEVRFEESGDFTLRSYNLTRILTDKGKKDLATAKIGYHRRYMDVHVIRARVINADGSVIVVGEEAIKDGTMTETQAMNILEENFRVRSITFPDLDVGDTIETEVEIVSKPMIKENYNDINLFQYDQPLLSKTVTIDGPAARPLYAVVKNGSLAHRKEEKGDRIIHTWSAENVARIVPELGMVPFKDVALKLIVSTFKDWKSLSAWGYRLNEGKVDINDAMKAKVAELTADREDLEDRILAINHFISKGVRYMGSSMDVGAFLECHEASYTFEKQYGICRDNSILMMAMLADIGVDAYDTLINMVSETEPEIPSIYFEHAICGVRMPDGRIVYVDPTLELSAGFGEPYVGGRYVLHLDEPGHDLVKLPPVPAEKSMGLIEIETELTADGRLKGDVTITGRGFYDFVLRSVAKETAGFQFAMLWQQLAASFLSNNVEIIKPTCNDFSDLNTPYQVTLGYELPDYVITVDRFTMFRVPAATHAFDLPQISVIKALTGLEERHHPMFLFSSRGTIQKERITIPAGYRIKAVPDPVDFAEGPVSLKMNISAEGNTIEFFSDFRLEKHRLSPDEYLILKRVIKKMNYFEKSMIILEKNTSS